MLLINFHRLSDFMRTSENDSVLYKFDLFHRSAEQAVIPGALFQDRHQKNGYLYLESISTRNARNGIFSIIRPFRALK